MYIVSRNLFQVREWPPVAAAFGDCLLQSTAAVLGEARLAGVTILRRAWEHIELFDKLVEQQTATLLSLRDR